VAGPCGGRLLLLVTIYCAFPILCYTVFSTDGYTDISCHVAISEGTWEVCADSQFNGTCERMGPGKYEVLNTALDKRISSLRRRY
jgi:hypothetical protein